MQHNRYALLDGIRGIAAILVLLRHTENFWHYGFYRSYLAVDLFFILSGFVISHAYDDNLKNGTLSASKFMTIRLVRLYPIFFISLIPSSAIFIGKEILAYHPLFSDALKMAAAIVVTAFFIPARITGDMSIFPVNGIYWSLFYELITNAVYASIRRFLSNTLLAGLLIVFGTSVGICAYQYGNLDSGFSRDLDSIVMGASRAFLGIFLGVFLHRHKKVLGMALKKASYPWLAFSFMIAAMMSPSAGNLDPLIDLLLVGLAFPIAVFIAAQQDKPTRLDRTLILLGTASYPIYVMHKPLASLVVYFMPSLVGPYAPFSGLVFLAALVAMSVVLEKYYDIPIRRWLSQRFIKKN